MSGKVSGRVWDLDLPHNKLIVLLAYADHADHAGSNIRPSVGLIAWKTGYSVKQIQRITQMLVNDDKLLLPVGTTSNGVKCYKFNWNAGKEKTTYVGKRKHGQNVAPSVDKMSPPVRHSYVAPDGDIHMSPKPSEEPSIEPVVEPLLENALVGSVYKAYHDAIGTLPPSMSPVIGDAIDEYTAEWILDAIQIAVENNKRKWTYIVAILKRWKDEGKDNGRGKPATAPAPVTVANPNDEFQERPTIHGYYVPEKRA